MAERQTVGGTEEDALEAYTALLLINKSDPKRYGDLINELSNQFTRGLNGYPDTVSKAFDMLVNYKPPRRNNANGSSWTTISTCESNSVHMRRSHEDTRTT